MPEPQRTSVPRLRRRLSVAALATASVALSLVAAAAPAGAAPTTASRYVRAVPVCAEATGPVSTCNAMRLVPTTANAPGARPMTARPAAIATGPAGGYAPSAVAAAYGVNPKTATAITVGIVDAQSDPNVLADLNVFDAQYGLPAETATSLRVVNQTGATTPLPTADAGWATEISLDVDAVRGLCNKCKIILVEANSPQDADLGAAENTAVSLGAKIVTNSYGRPESGGAPSAAFVNAFKHPGVAITVSTGDHGFYEWDKINSGGASANSPEIPAAFPTTVAVGGTSLYLNDAGARASETVWNENGPYDQFGNALQFSLGATGGGCSTLYAAQAFQSSVAGYASMGCAGKRLTADIAALADPYTGYDVYDSYQTSTSWATYGGTSLASPLIAAMWALAGGPKGVTYPAKTLYQHYAADSPRSTYDVQVGGNGACNNTSNTSCSGFFGGSPNVFAGSRVDCSFAAPPSTAVIAANGQCDAKVGFDGPSGVGTPIGLATFQPLA